MRGNTGSEDSRDAMELVALADRNMYRSKSQGGNKITVQEEDSHEAALLNLDGCELFRAMLVAIDNTIVNVALPTLNRRINGSTADLQDPVLRRLR